MRKGGSNKSIDCTVKQQIITVLIPKQLKTEKVTVIFRKLTSKKFTDGNGNLHHGTKPSDWIWGPQLTDPTFCRNLNATPLTHPTFGCVFNCKTFKKPYMLPQVSDHEIENPMFCYIFTAMTAFSATTSLKSHVLQCF